MVLKILKFDHLGRGIAKNDNKIFFVEKALPGEIVDVVITKTKKNYSEARIEKIIEKSTQRIESICPYYDKCGGCQFLHTTYDEEISFKKEKAKELLGRVDSIFKTNHLNYRNKVTLHVMDNKIGFYEEKSHQIIPIDYCFLVDNKINDVIKKLHSISMDNYSIQKIIIKCNNGKLLLDVDGIVDDFFITCFDNVDTIISHNKIVKGKGYQEERIAKKIFKITSNAFFQVNKEGLENIHSIIESFLKNKKINKALDLYSGTSLWGILISDYVQEVTSVEINKEACMNALYNIQKNNITNIQVINGKVEDYVDTFKDIDLCIIDPPRSGLDKKTRDYLKMIATKYLIYISCDMITLKRDLQELKEIYNISKIDLVDMFKRTYHVESVCLLSRKTVDK